MFSRSSTSRIPVTRAASGSASSASKKKMETLNVVGRKNKIKISTSDDRLSKEPPIQKKFARSTSKSIVEQKVRVQSAPEVLEVVANGVSNLKSCLKSKSSIKVAKKVIFSPSVIEKERQIATLGKPATPSKMTISFSSANLNENENEEIVETFDNNALDDILGSHSAKDLDERSHSQAAPPGKRISIFGPPVRVARKTRSTKTKPASRTPLSQKNEQETIGLKPLGESKLVSTSKIARRLGMLLLESKMEIEETPVKAKETYNPFD